MALNIKNQEAHKLANEIARLTGKNLTKVVTDALRQNLEQLQREQNVALRVKELLAISERIREHLHEPIHSSDHAEMLYDENGLPK